MSIRCKHHLSKFNNSSKQFISYVFRGLLTVITQENTPVLEEIIGFLQVGICKNCAHHAAIKLTLIPTISQQTIFTQLLYMQKLAK